MQTPRRNFKEIQITGNTGTKIVVNSGTTVEIISIVDNPVKKTITANIIGKPYMVILWEDAAYDVIGQWTDANVSARIIELFKDK